MTPAAAPPPRRVMVCADDLGLSPALSDAMLALARAGRIHAMSALANAPDWPRAGRLAAAPPAGVALGLHFNLTEGVPLSAALRAHWPQLPSLGRLLALSHLGALPRAAIAAELQAQWQAFVDACGRTPDYIDGHQHVHHLPGVRPALLALARQHRLPVRNTGRVAGPARGVKGWLIEATGGWALQRALRAEGLPHNRVLLGVYDFVAADYRRLVQAWLAQAPAEGALLMCHPGPARPEPGDPIGAARAREAAYLGSADFDADLRSAAVSPGPAWDRSSSGG